MDGGGSEFVLSSTGGLTCGTEVQMFPGSWVMNDLAIGVGNFRP